MDVCHDEVMMRAIRDCAELGKARRTTVVPIQKTMKTLRLSTATSSKTSSLFEENQINERDTFALPAPALVIDLFALDSIK